MTRGECHVWWARPDHRRPWMVALLDPTERNRLESLRRECDADRFVVAAALARAIVGSHLRREPGDVVLDRRCRDCGGPHGKPRVMGGALELSITHSGGRVGVAVAAAPVGLDVEEVTAGRVTAAAVTAEALAEHVLSAVERRSFDRLPVAQRRSALLTYWTRKEAVLKATGDGLRIDPSSLTVSAPGVAPRLLGWSGGRPGPECSALADLRPGRGFVACVSVLDSVPLRVVERDGERLLAGIRPSSGPGAPGG